MLLFLPCNIQSRFPTVALTSQVEYSRNLQVTLLNFMATPDGLQDQMLGILVAKEEPEVERKRQNLIVESVGIPKVL